jgi:hypothetical protein
VTEIDAHRKTLRVHGYDDAIHFDYLVIATGTSYAFPLKVAEPTVARLAGLLDGFAGEVKRARKVVVVGGGPVGIELCGEIRDAHPNTEIVLVHSDGALVSGVPNTAFRQSLAERLAKVGVSVLLNERVVVPDEARRPGDDASASASSTYSTESSESYTDYGPADGPTTATPGLRYLTGRRDLSLRSGKVIPSADLVVFATGAATNSSCYLRSGFNLGQRERLVTDEFLRVTGAGSVMAATHRLKLFLCKKKKNEELSEELSMNQKLTLYAPFFCPFITVTLTITCPFILSTVPRVTGASLRLVTAPTSRRRWVSWQASRASTSPL